MRVFFKPSFIRDFNKLPTDIKDVVRKICVETSPNLGDFRNFRKHRVKLLKGFKNYYRIKIGEYRIGLKKKKMTL